jgi:hypothetical protein
MADLIKMSLRKAHIAGKRPKKRPTGAHHNGRDPHMITWANAQPGKIVSSNVPVHPNYNLNRALAHNLILEPENNQRQRPRRAPHEAQRSV